MRTIKKTIVIITLLFAANIMQAQKLAPMLDYCNLSKNTAEKNQIAVKQIRQVRGTNTDFVCEYFTIVCNYNKKDPYFCVIDSAFMNIVKVTKNDYVSVNNRTHELANYDKKSEQYQVYRYDTENKIYSLNYYQYPISKLTPYEPIKITSRTDLTIRYTPCILFVAEETNDYFDNRGKTKLGTMYYKKSIYINKTSGNIDSLIYQRTFSDGREYINKEYITDITNFDFNTLSSQLNFDNPKYSDYSRHNADNPPFSTKASNNKEINSTILNYPIINLQGQVTKLADMKGWVLLDFWQFGCRSCFAQFKQFAHERDSIGNTILEKEGVQILSIHPYSDNMEMISQIGEKYHVSKYLNSAKGLNGQLEMYSYPTYYLISPDKKVALKTNHLGDYSEILTIIKNNK